MKKRPFPKTYWVVEDRLLAGEYPGARDLDSAVAKLNALLDCGITVIVNLMEEEEIASSGMPFAPYLHLWEELAAERGIAVSFYRFPIYNYSITTTKGMRQVLDTINLHLFERREAVYVHCWKGIGRTGTVIGCWLLDQGVCDKDQVYARIDYLRELPMGRTTVLDTVEQEKFVKDWGGSEQKD